MTTADQHEAAATVLCRVCGEALASQRGDCPCCNTPIRARHPNPLDITWVDVVLATLAAITTLAISLPATIWLAGFLQRGPFVGGALEAAAAISTLNGWLIGVPIGIAVWRWRDRIRDDDLYHAVAIRDYWQIQALCLIPPGMIVIPILMFSLWINLF